MKEIKRKLKFYITFLENWRKKGNKFLGACQQMKFIRQNKNELMRNAYNAIKILQEMQKYFKIEKHHHPYCNKLNAKFEKIMKNYKIQMGFMMTFCGNFISIKEKILTKLTKRKISNISFNRNLQTKKTK